MCKETFGHLLSREKTKNIDILSAYRVGDIRRALASFKKRNHARLRACFANMWDDCLLAIYLRKYHDREPHQIREAVIDSIKGLLGQKIKVKIEQQEVKQQETKQQEVKISLSNVTDPPQAHYEIKLTQQRITYSFYRIDDFAFIVPLDMKKAQDPAPLVWVLEKETAPNAFTHYLNEYDKMFEEAVVHVYP